MPIVTGSLKCSGLDYFDKILSLNENVETYSRLRELYLKKQNYELGMMLEEISRERFEVPINFLDIYKSNINNFSISFDPVVRAKILFNIAHYHLDGDEVLDLLKDIDKNFTANSVAHIIAKLSFVIFHLRTSELIEAKNHLMDVKEMVSNLRNVTAAHAYYYRMKSLYFELSCDADKYYRVTLKYLGCIKLDNLKQQEKQSLAYNLAIAAIISTQSYSLIELANHPIMQSLSSTNSEMLCTLLKSLGKYDLVLFNSCREFVRSVPNLELNYDKIVLKLKIIGLAEMCSCAEVMKGKPVSFSIISDNLQIPLEDVEKFLMKVFSLNYLRGKIDEKSGQVYITYIQPKCLDLDQIENLRNRLSSWIEYSRLASGHLVPLQRYLQQNAS